MFSPVTGQVRFPELEERIGKFWDEHKIYEETLKNRAGAPRFVFYEGPPTANGMPHPGHCLTRAIKDLFPRYKTMRGFLCERKAGWDTHGLPVEVEVCKELGIHSKEQIEEYGIEPFIHKCQASVWRYMQEWERMTQRLGFWVNLDQAYVTYHQSFVESVWWSLAELFNKNLLYQGHKIVWWWAQGGTALSSGEVGQGYREVADPSVYVKFPIVMDERAKELGIPEGTSLLVWTTTPWTLPSNQFAAVGTNIFYSIAEDEASGEKVIFNDDVPLDEFSHKFKRTFKVIVSHIQGSELIGLRYTPPFDHYHKQHGNHVEKLFGSTEEARRQHLEGYYWAFENQNDPRLKKTEDHIAWKVTSGTFVTTDSGTGIVHIAPAFGEVDFDVLKSEQNRYYPDTGPRLINCVDSNGKFTHEGPDYCAGRWVKDCDKDIIRDLKTRGLLFHREEYLHDYPFCWRAENDPLIQYPRKSWFIRTSQFKDQMLANNSKINWLPEHIRDGRFGNFLATNVDWALSRERYWGTPLPIWVCQQTGKMEAVPSYDELKKKPGATGFEVWEKAKAAAAAEGKTLVEDLKVHKPYIDEITYDSPFAAGAHMRRVPDVIDCWYDSGAMPFAQWGYPHQNAEKFKQQFPADFISEAIDQTRGWFYSQLAISTLLFGDHAANTAPGSRPHDPQRDAPITPYPKSPSGAKALADTKTHPYPHPFKNCIVLGLMLGEDGTKMSKSKRNYREPTEIFDKYGADALRWYFYATQPPWTTIRYSEQAIKDSIPEFLLKLWNVYSFFVIYANIDEFDPAKLLAGDVGQLEPEVLQSGKQYRPIAERNELDRWIMSELHRVSAAVIEAMDRYDNYGACEKIIAFVDALSNWYVRRSRDRFWANDKKDQAKLDAYWTLYECLLATTKLVAPFVPFLAEELWQNLAVVPFENRATESVHLCDYPEGDAAVIDEALSTRMNLVREIASLGRAARMSAKLKVRQPLAKVEVVLADNSQQDWLCQHDGLIREELNVKLVEFTTHAEQYIDYTVLPDLKKLGPKIGKRLPDLKRALAVADAAALLKEMQANGKVSLMVGDAPLELTSDELIIRLQAKPGWTAAQGHECVVVLSTEVSPELIAEGISNEIVHAIQSIRKDLKLEYTDRIKIGLVSDSKAITEAAKQFSESISSETLADELVFSKPVGAGEATKATINDAAVEIYVLKQ